MSALTELLRNFWNSWNFYGTTQIQSGISVEVKSSEVPQKMCENTDFMLMFLNIHHTLLTTLLFFGTLELYIYILLIILITAVPHEFRKVPLVP